MFANEAFYAAFNGRDLDAMDAVWAHTDSVTCIHPGWAPLTGRRAVMQSWRAILTNPNAPSISCRDERASIHGDVACVICVEVLEAGFLAATNVFVRDGSAWKMIHHHAGVCPSPAPAPESPRDVVQ